MFSAENLNKKREWSQRTRQFEVVNRKSVLEKRAIKDSIFEEIYSAWLIFRSNSEKKSKEKILGREPIGRNRSVTLLCKTKDSSGVSRVKKGIQFSIHKRLSRETQRHSSRWFWNQTNTTTSTLLPVFNNRLVVWKNASMSRTAFNVENENEFDFEWQVIQWRQRLVEFVWRRRIRFCQLFSLSSQTWISMFNWPAECRESSSATMIV